MAPGSIALQTICLYCYHLQRSVWVNGSYHEATIIKIDNWNCDQKSDFWAYHYGVTDPTLLKLEVNFFKSDLTCWHKLALKRVYLFPHTAKVNYGTKGCYIRHILAVPNMQQLSPMPWPNMWNSVSVPMSGILILLKDHTMLQSFKYQIVRVNVWIQ